MFTLQQLNALETAIATGARSATVDGRQVTFNSLNDMLRVRSIMQVALGITSGQSATMLASHDRGHGIPQGYGDYGGFSDGGGR